MATLQALLCGTIYLVLIANVPVIEGRTTCRYSSGFHFSMYYHCKDNQYCCKRNDEDDCCDDAAVLAVGAIVGICIGSLSAIGFLISCICACVQKSKARPRMAVAPNQPVTFVTPTGQTHMHNAYPGPPGQQNFYGQPSGSYNNYSGNPAVPPPNGQESSAYPPPKL